MSTSPFEVQIFVSAPADKRPYYKRDVLNLCCLPPDDHIDLAFRHTWVSSTVLNHIEDDVTQLQGWHVRIFFCERTESEAGDVYRFHPLRRARIVSVSDDDSVATFKLRLGKFMAFNAADAEAIRNALANPNEEHPNHRFEAADGTHPLSKFVRCAPVSDGLIGTTDSWDSFVMRMRSLNGLKDSLFFVTSDDSVANYPKYPFERLARGYRNRREAKLIRGNEVQLNLYAVPGQGVDFLPPDVRVSETVARVNGPYVRQLRNGYAMYFGIQAKPGWDRDIATVTISLPSRAANSSVVKFNSPEIFVHIRALPRKGLTAFVIGLLIGGAALSSFDQNTVVEMGLAKEWSLVAKAVGPILLGVGVWLGFRKLPKI